MINERTQTWNPRYVGGKKSHTWDRESMRGTHVRHSYTILFSWTLLPDLFSRRARYHWQKWDWKQVRKPWQNIRVWRAHATKKRPARLRNSKQTYSKKGLSSPRITRVMNMTNSQPISRLSFIGDHTKFWFFDPKPVLLYRHKSTLTFPVNKEIDENKKPRASFSSDA